VKLRRDFQNARDIAHRSFARHGNFPQNKTGDECNPVTGSNSNHARNCQAILTTERPAVQ